VCDCARHLQRESESAPAGATRDSDSVDSLRRSNQALVTWLTEKNAQVDFLRAESKQYRAEIERCRMESGQYWVESEWYRAKSEQYRAESKKHRAESERHRMESEGHRAESERYRAVSNRLMDDLEAAHGENDDLERHFLERHFRRAQTQLRILRAVLSSRERCIVAAPAALPHQAPRYQPAVFEVAREPSVLVLDNSSEDEPIPEPDTDGGPSAKERARKRKGKGQDRRRTKARCTTIQEHRYPTPSRN
jgi:hypothetical protein